MESLQNHFQPGVGESRGNTVHLIQQEFDDYYLILFESRQFIPRNHDFVLSDLILLKFREKSFYNYGKVKQRQYS